MIDLKAFGPFEVPSNKIRGTRDIDKKNVKSFWLENGEFSRKQGIYVYALSSGPSYTPWYIGKTNNSFDNECFHDSKLLKYNKALKKRNGIPVLFFICKDGNQKVIDRKVLGQIEDFFIQQGFAKNKALLNIIGKPKYQWSIKGVFNSEQGQPPLAAKELNLCMGF